MDKKSLDSILPIYRFYICPCRAPGPELATWDRELVSSPASRARLASVRTQQQLITHKATLQLRKWRHSDRYLHIESENIFVVLGES